MENTSKTLSSTSEDIEQYNLPPAPVKRSDSRTSSFIAEHGDVSVELDALPPKILQTKITDSIEQLLDLSVFDKELSMQEEDSQKLEALIEEIQ